MARDIYIAKIKQAEKERLAKLAKAKAVAEAELATQGTNPPLQYRLYNGSNNHHHHPTHPCFSLSERARKAVENRIMMENQKATLESQQRQGRVWCRMYSNVLSTI